MQKTLPSTPEGNDTERERQSRAHEALRTLGFQVHLTAWRLGRSCQRDLNFRQGRWWSSHPGMTQGQRACPGFIAQGILNHTVANLDRVTAVVENALTMSVAQQDRGGRESATRNISSLEANVFADPGKVAVALADLRLTDPQSLEIRLPTVAVRRTTTHYLAGNPQKTNLEATRVTAQVRSVDLAQFRVGRLQTTIPPGIAAVSVFE